MTRPSTALRTIACAAVLAISCKAETTTDDTPSGTTADTDTGTTPVAQGIDVSVFSSGAPAIGALVVFHDASGAVLGTATTNSSGAARFEDFPVGGAVTASAPSSQYDNLLLTSFDHDPGDVVRLDTELSAATVVGPANVTVPAFAGATSYRLDTGCGWRTPTAGVPYEYTMRSQCVDADNRVHFMAYALGPTDVPLAWSTATDVFASATSAPDVTMGPWNETFRSFAISATNTPAPLDSLELIAFDTKAAIVVYSDTVVREAPVAQGASVNATAEYVTGALDGVGMGALMSGQSGSQQFQSLLYRGFEVVPGSVSVNLTNDLIPPFESTSIDHAGRAFSWTTSSPVSDLDGLIGALSWQIGKAEHTWIVHSPPTESVVLPALPKDLEGRWPASASAFARLPTVILYDHSTFDGWSDARERFGPAFLSGIALETEFELRYAGVF